MQPGIDFVGISTPFYCNDGQGNFLLHKRSNKTRDDHGTWDTGGGKLDWGLLPAENVLKEVLEEYGCQGTIQEALAYYTIFREWEGKKTHWLALPFFIKVNPHEVKNNEPEKIDEIGWFRLENFPEPLHPGVRKSIIENKTYFEKYSI
jgi:ADP-ribose pyrophosphatase YjhB (NUDIX family)